MVGAFTRIEWDEQEEGSELVQEEAEYTSRGMPAGSTTLADDVVGWTLGIRVQLVVEGRGVHRRTKEVDSMAGPGPPKSRRVSLVWVGELV
jgi:hypothetical protein